MTNPNPQREENFKTAKIDASTTMAQVSMLSIEFANMGWTYMRQPTASYQHSTTMNQTHG
ncbi:hypothetical protein I7I48_03252 [Histoplasma ohiense]|nr:hypothetical protein I7I48_03252 [Histoplasma ohiense (nom. inval.)]